MASELSTFIEKELKNKGYQYDEEDPAAENASLMGVLRVEVRLGARARTAARPPRATGLLLPRLGSADVGDVNPAGPVRVPSARRDHDQKEKELLHGFS